MLTFLLTGLSASQAQRTIYRSTDAKLEAHVHLSLGLATAEQVGAELSRQTGLRIEPAAYLQKRVLDVEFEDLTVRAALDAIAELNDWKWQEIGLGHLVFSRRVPPAPQKLTDVPSAMIAALPKDWRTYLFIDVPWQEAKIASGYTPQNLAAPAFSARNVRGAMSTRSIRLINRLQDDLISRMKFPITKGGTYDYARLSTEQRDDLAAIMFLRALHETNFDLLQNHLTPYQLNFNSATMEIRDRAVFFIGTYTQKGAETHFESFGTQLVGDHALPDDDTLALPGNPLQPK